MFASVSQCVEPVSQPCRLKVKVTVQGHGFEPWISCPLCISFTPGRIFFKLWSYVCLIETMCRTHHSTMPTQGQGHSSRSQFKVTGLSLWISCLLCISYTSGRFSLNFGQMFTLVRRCAESISQPCRLKVKVMGLSLEFRVCSVSPLPLEGFFLNFGQMFTCGMMCRTHVRTMGTQGQGHSSGSPVWALNFVSIQYLLYPWKDFLLILVKCLPQWNDVRNP